MDLLDEAGHRYDGDQDFHDRVLAVRQILGWKASDWWDDPVAMGIAAGLLLAEQAQQAEAVS